MPESTPSIVPTSSNGNATNGNATNGKSKPSNGNTANGDNPLESHGTTVTDPDEISSPELQNVETAQAGQPSTTGTGSTGWTPGFRAQTSSERALEFSRHFTRSGEDPFSTANWEKRTASITGENGKSVFEQKDCEIPTHWSQLATNVVVSKYFRGPMDTPQRETSVKQVIGRVADTIHGWGKSGGYFASDEDAQAFRDELIYLLVHQYGSFNSPVWFNLGVKGSRAQASACQPYDALVSTPSGLIPIGELVEKNAVGTEVFDAHGVARIVAVKANGTKTVLRVHTKAGYTLDVTGDHLVWKQGKFSNNPKAGKWVEAATLQVGDRLMWHRTPAIDKAQEFSSEVAEAALAGWLQSDGFVGQYEGTNRSLTIETITVNGEEEAWVRAALNAVFPAAHSHTRPVETQNSELDCKRIRMYGEFLAPFIEKWDLHARRHDMRVPASLYTAPLSVVVAYLRSLFQAEGYVSVCENAVVGLDMMGEEMMRGVQRLLLRVGIYSRLRRNEDARPDRAGMWSLAIRTLGDRQLFTEEIGFIGEDKQKKLLASLQLKGLRAFEAKTMQIERIEIRGEMPVFDIQTTSGEYLSNNIRVHNCFINSVYDDMESIMELAATEARLFKGGSGAGTNLFRIRSSREQLSGGGIASGPVSFMRGWDAFAGAIKSGGTTRRAAKMVILNADHPDIAEFITCKANEEKKAWALIDAGYNGGFNVPGGAYDSVDFQNANHSVRVTDEFMRAAENGAQWSTRAVTSGKVVETLNARDLLHSIAETTHICGDPGLQYDTTLNDWHTCSNTGRINASNPCCVTGDTLVAVADGRVAVPIKDLVGTEVPVFAHDHSTGKTTISRMWNIEVKRHNVPVFRVTLDDGSTFRATDDHLIMLRDGSYRMVRDLNAGDSLMPFHSKVLSPEKNRTKRRYIWNGASWTPQYRALWNALNGEQPRGTHIHHADFDALNDAVSNLVLMSAEDHNALHLSNTQGDANPARRLMNDAWRSNIARATSGENNPMWGRTHSDATKASMSARAKARFEDPLERDLAASRALQWQEEARAQGRKIGRTPKERTQRCCPVCRDNFGAARETQVFCSNECRQSPMGRAMIGAKGGAAKQDRTLSAETRAKLSLSVSAASNPAQKSQAARAGHRNTALKTARLLLDNGFTPSLDNWAQMRETARELGVKRVPQSGLMNALFSSSVELQDAATHYNHKVVSVEACGFEDVYDGTVDTHHNFAILTSTEDSSVQNHANYSGIFIHNSEFVFLDDTACNLASINLLKFYDFETGAFDAKSYVHACDTFITAQEIIVSYASYPTAKIAENSELFRPLGLGYCNIGALLMAMGLAYDSDEGRAFAGALTAIMTGAAYRQSARIAHNTGPFEGFARNREPMLRVIGKHRDAVAHIDHALVAPNVMDEAQGCWDEALALGQKHGYRNSQVTVLAPTGCLVAGSLISTDKGLVRLERLGNPNGETWQKANFRVYTDGGAQEATKFFINGLDQTRVISTEAGYSVQGTPKHRVKVVNPQSGEWNWKHFRDIEAGDLLPLAMNTLIGEAQTVQLPLLGELHWNGDWNTKVPAHMTPELAELVGYFMGDGSLHAKGLRFCVADGDEDVAARLSDLGRELFGLQAHHTPQKGYLEVAFHSVPLTLWWDAAGFTKARPNAEHAGKGYIPRVPDAVLHANDARIYGAFLRGLYEADGTLILGVPAVSTAHQDFASEIRSLLLALGFPTSTKQDVSQWGGSALHVLRLRNGSYNPRFQSQIGFIGARKSNAVIELKGALSGKRDRVFLPREVWNELVPATHPLRNAVQIALKRHGGVARQLAAQVHAQSGDERLGHVLNFFFDSVQSNDDGGEQMTFDLSVPGNVTYTANGFVSHNTISFMMDADTTGVEPDIALVKYKKLVGGGLLKIVNQTVPAALRKLGYGENEITAIVEYIDKNDTIEGAPQLRDEDLSVFDCAFKAMNGVRSIHHMGHVKMMAAAQPFLSGAISKCVTGDTMIVSTEGLFPIGSLYRGEKPGEFCDIEATLASIDAPQKADLFYYGGLRPTKRALLADGRKLEGTWNHRVKVANTNGYGWKLLEDLETGDFVSVRLGANVWAEKDADLLHDFKPAPLHTAQKRIQLPARMTPQLARFLGHYIAEGNKTATNYTVRVTNLNHSVLDHCMTTVREQFGMEGRIETDKRNGVTSFVVASKTLCEFLTHIGADGDSSSKQIPWSVLRSSEECVREFIGGLWLNGYVRSDGMTAICLNSPELLRQLQVVLNNFGLRAHIIQKWNPQYEKHYGELGMHGADARHFARLFRLDDAHKTAALEALCAQPKQVHSVHSDVIPAFKTEIQTFIKERHDTQRFRHLFDARTRYMSWHSVKAVADFYGEAFFAAIPDLREILESNIHFVALKSVEDDYSPVFDFQVPTNHAFLGNSIVNHNTVNMPQDCTVDEIMDAYIQSWKLGVKAVAIYRDNSKRTQPLSTSSDAQKAEKKAEKKEADVKRALRRKLPDERMSITHKFSIAGQEGYFMVGLYEDGSPGEIFIKMSKEGSTISGLMDSFAVAISMCLQYGVPLRVLVNKFSHTRFEPSGYTTNRDIPIAKSLMDYIFRWFDQKFHPNGDNGHFGKPAPAPEGSEPEPAKATRASTAPALATLPTLFSTPTHEKGARNGNLADAQASLMQSQADSPPCPNCGAITVRSGACYKCNECGTTTGCG